MLAQPLALRARLQLQLVAVRHGHALLKLKAGRGEARARHRGAGQEVGEGCAEALAPACMGLRTGAARCAQTARARAMRQAMRQPTGS